MRSQVCAALAAGVIGSISSLAAADIINIQGDPSNSSEGFGNFSGLIQYEFQSGDTGLLDIQLTNTSDPLLGGFITGFVFNIGAPRYSQADTAALLFSTHPSIVNIPGPGVNAMPFGYFNAGAGIGGQFEGGGSPNTGIGVGSSGAFQFEVTSDFASTLTASSFIDGPNEFNFVVRFRGFANGGSDKVPVPAPASAALLGIGAVAVGARRRRSN
ncbi:MAG: PEP-CTERM sorting domain-containing protein [Phycisphaerales bacterium]|nr:PEP-CTERM sorting domain-containing protein [Phycisphaerales bacterium]